MGLDLALGVVILIAAVRGWFKGFVGQAVRLVATVIAVYAAVRVRDYAKPYCVPYLTTIQPDLIDRILWWVAAVVTFLVLAGVASLVIKMTRRPEIPGISQSGKNDQFAGFFLGALKGIVIAAFLAAGIQNYALEQAKNVSWADDQAKASWALKWNETYQPARKIWASKPVRHFVNYIQRMGLHRPGYDDDTNRGELEQEGLVRTASRPDDAAGSGSGSSSGDSRESAGSSVSGGAIPPEANETTSGKSPGHSRSEARPAPHDAN